MSSRLTRPSSRTGATPVSSRIARSSRSARTTLDDASAPRESLPRSFTNRLQRAIIKRVRLLLITCVLAAATVTAAAASAARVSEARGKACLQSHGFKVASRPNLGAASVAANDWFAATRGAVEVDVAYFSNVLGATYARAVLAALMKSTAAGLDMTVTGLRQNGRVVYWWMDSPARYGPVVQACLGR